MMPLGKRPFVQIWQKFEYDLQTFSLTCEKFKDPDLQVESFEFLKQMMRFWTLSF